jgi:hypothetical protein
MHYARSDERRKPRALILLRSRSMRRERLLEFQIAVPVGCFAAMDQRAFATVAASIGTSALDHPPDHRDELLPALGLI